MFKSVLAFVLLILSQACFAQDNVKILLEKAFVKTFNSAQEFRNCKVFRLLGYDLAETDFIGRITPHPTDLKIEYAYAENGGFSAIKASCEKVHYYNMIIEHVDFIFPNCELDTKKLNEGKLSFIKADEIELKIDVSETDVLSVFQLYAKAKALSKLKMVFSKNKCKLTGRVKQGLFVADFEVTGNTKLINPKQVDFVCDKMVINGQVQPRSFAKAAFAGINPVFDGTTTWLNLHLSEIRIIDGFVETRATIKRKNS